MFLVVCSCVWYCSGVGSVVACVVNHVLSFVRWLFRKFVTVFVFGILNRDCSRSAESCLSVPLDVWLVMMVPVAGWCVLCCVSRVLSFCVFVVRSSCYCYRQYCCAWVWFVCITGRGWCIRCCGKFRFLRLMERSCCRWLCTNVCVECRSCCDEVLPVTGVELCHVVMCTVGGGSIFPGVCIHHVWPMVCEVIDRGGSSGTFGWFLCVGVLRLHTCVCEPFLLVKNNWLIFLFFE